MPPARIALHLRPGHVELPHSEGALYALTLLPGHHRSTRHSGIDPLDRFAVQRTNLTSRLYSPTVEGPPRSVSPTTFVATSPEETSQLSRYRTAINAR